MGTQRLRQGRGSSLLRRRSWLITRLDGVSGIQGTGGKFTVTPIEARKIKRLGRRGLAVIWIDLSQRPILLATEVKKKNNKIYLQYYHM